MKITNFIHLRGSSSVEADVFRSHYSRLSELRSLLHSYTPMVALTATATNDTRSYILENLSLISPKCLIETPERENIKYSVIDIKENMTEDFLNPLVNDIKEMGYLAKRVLIFCRTMKDVNLVYDVFENNLEDIYSNYLVRPYAMFHSKTDPVVKEHIINEFSKVNGSVRILIATIAFGMGVDCKGLYTIIHFSPPASLEDYFQETGRAGRDGLQSNAVLVNKPRCLSSKNITKSMKDYVLNKELCRRKILLQEFGEIPSNMIPNYNCCDICEKECDEFDVFSDDKWWLLKEVKTKTSFSDDNKLKLSSHLKTEFCERLKNIKSTLCDKKGQTSPDILSGFPEQSINEVADVCYRGISVEELYQKTSILNKEIVVTIIAEIDNFFSQNEEKIIFNEPDEDSFSSISDSGKCSALSETESVDSLEFHVNISFSDSE